MAIADRVRELALPLLDERDIDLYDIEVSGPVVTVVLDRTTGLDLDVLADATRAISRALDDADPIAGTYTLEVTSPGLERRLRTPHHFTRAVGETVKVKLAAGVSDDRRLAGELVAADDEGITVRADAGDERRVAYTDIDRARTVFEWGPGDKPGGPRRSGRTSAARTKGPSNEKRDHTP